MTFRFSSYNSQQLHASLAPRWFLDTGSGPHRPDWGCRVSLALVPESPVTLAFQTSVVSRLAESTRTNYQVKSKSMVEMFTSLVELKLGSKSCENLGGL